MTANTDNLPATEQRYAISTAGLIGASALGGALAGFFLQLLVAYYFGAGSQTDAFFMAQSTSDLLRKLLLGGSITAVFLPMFVALAAAGQKEKAWQLGLNLLHVTAAIFISLIILLGIFAEQFVHLIAPGFSSELAAETVRLLRVLLPSFLFLFLIDLATAMLHSVKHFTTSALLRIVAPLASIATVVSLAQTIGIYALAIGVVLGALLQLLFVARALRRQGLTYHFIFRPFDPAMKKLLFLVYPFIYSVLVTQAAGIVYRILVSDLSVGSLSALKYAEKIFQLIAFMFLNSVTIVAFPLLSQKAGAGNYQGMRDTIASAIRLVTFVTCPLLVGVILLREPLVGFLYERGSFLAHDTAATSMALLFFMLGLTVNGYSSILGYAVLALQKTRVSVFVTITSQVTAIGLFYFLTPRMGHAGLALASSLVPLVISMLYFAYLTKYIEKLRTIFWHDIFLKIAVLTTALGLSVYACLDYIAQIPAPRQLSLLLQLFIPTLVGSIIYFGGAYLWRISEMHEVMALVRAKLKKKKLA